MTSNQVAALKAEIERQHYERQDAEAHRANMFDAAIRHASNVVSNQHYLRSDAETQRANLAREKENTRTNKANEALRQYEASIKEYDALSAGVLRASQAAYADAQAALSALQGQHEIVKTEKTRQEWINSMWEKANIIADTDLKRTQRDKYISDTAYAPYYAASSLMSGFGSLLRGGSGYVNLGGKSNVQENSSTYKQSERYYRNGVEYTNIFEGTVLE